MSSEKINQTKESLGSYNKKKDAIAFVVAAIFVLGLLFWAYNYFNGTNIFNSEWIKNAKYSFSKNLNNTKDIIASKTTRETTKENTQTNLTTTQGSQTNQNTINNTESNSNNSKVSSNNSNDVINQNAISDLSKWVATNYNPGDIKGDEHIVKSGDTLWEIAEGRYGNGSEWTKILQANSSKVGYLPNGQQALIFPGQKLILPN